MFQNDSVAQDVSTLMLDIGAKLNASLAQVQTECSASEFERYREVIGHLMGEMLTEVMNPIYSRHPQLRPKELD